MSQVADLTVCSPLWFEARAVRRGLGDLGEVRQTGYGRRKSLAQAEQLAAEAAAGRGGPVAVAGTCGGLSADLRPGDVVVGERITGPDGQVHECASAPLLAGELRRAGMRASAAQVSTVTRLFSRAEAARAAAEGSAAVEMEAAYLLGAAAGRPSIVLRAVSDTPGHPLLGPTAVTGGLAALRSLTRAAPALARWAAACGPRTLLLAAPRSFCAGVDRAIEIVQRAVSQPAGPVYVRKQIVHNSHVVAGLERQGAIFVDELAEVPDGATVVFSAHGVSPAIRTEAAGRNMRTIDATCPLVAKVHAEARRYAADGYLVVLIGHSGHEEVEGTLGEAPGCVVLVQDEADVAALDPADPAKVAYLMQTTLSVEEASGLVSALLERFPSACGPGSDDICYATTNRQHAVRAVASEADLVLVAGSANSSNSQRLVETAQRAGTPAYLIDDTGDIELGWLAGARTVGVTAGASAPPVLVDQIVAALAGLGQVQVTERVIATETVRFGLPKEVQPKHVQQRGTRQR
jgi:4-hydroxy-3-methylbut-2-en-1-yl diphosphate reductase